MNAESTLITGLQSDGVQRRLSEKKLYEHFFYLTRVAIRKYSLTEDECASAYSDTIIGIIDNIVNRRFEGRSSLKTYTYQIFMNKCVDVVRKKTTHKNSVLNTDAMDAYIFSLPDKARNIVQQMIEKSNRLTLTQKIQELGEKCKQLLLMFEDGYSDKEIALEMNYNSVDVVKTSRLRCLDKLREKVGTLQWNE
ncbi:MAG TPA: sigma-70 family RNA polymerase sigma factor [Ohtaekwangia sp.]|nr:sigma-70 family RNA polymerase sigma factor [Ohtaekwangia sp.]